MSFKVISTAKAPQAIGPYSQATQTEANTFIFVSGQLGINPQTKELVKGGVKKQTEQILENIKNILEEANTNLDKVVKTTVFMTNLDDFPVMNEVYETYFKTDYPARSTVQVARLPKGALVEIEAIASS